MLLVARRLLFMPDYDADPLWDLRDESMVNLDELPIPASTRQAIRAWAGRWEKLAWQGMHADDVAAGQVEGPSTPVPAAAWAEVERDSRLLWLELQRALGNACKVGRVVFTDGSTSSRPMEPDGPIKPG